MQTDLSPIPHALRSPNYRRIHAQIRQHQHTINILRSRMADAQNPPAIDVLYATLLRVTGFRAVELQRRSGGNLLRDVRSMFAQLANSYGYNRAEIAATLDCSTEEVDDLLAHYAERIYDLRYRHTAQGVFHGVRSQLKNVAQ